MRKHYRCFVRIVDVLDKIAAHLIEKETITGKEFMKIYREAKGGLPEPEENKEEKKEEK